MEADKLFEVFQILQDAFVPLTALVFGLVEFLKAVFGMEGKAVTLLSFAVGVVVAAIVAAAYLFPAWGVYLGVALFVLTAGLVASGFYKFGAKFK